MSQACSRKVLAHSPLGTVEESRCGTLHVTVGPVTLHLDNDAFAALTALLQSAWLDKQAGKRRAVDDLKLLFGEGIAGGKDRLD